jgi:hypothetical protein
MLALATGGLFSREFAIQQGIVCLAQGILFVALGRVHSQVRRRGFCCGAGLLPCDRIARYEWSESRLSIDLKRRALRWLVLIRSSSAGRPASDVLLAIVRSFFPPAPRSRFYGREDGISWISRAQRRNCSSSSVGGAFECGCFRVRVWSLRNELPHLVKGVRCRAFIELKHAVTTDLLTARDLRQVRLSFAET